MEVSYLSVYFVFFLAFVQSSISQNGRWSIDAPRSSRNAPGSHLLVSYNLSKEIRASIVDTNNLVRRTVEPRAANMRRITWDNDLEKLASEYSTKCKFALNKNKKMKRFRRVEELIYVSQDIEFDELYAVQATGRWGEEGTYYDYEMNKCTKQEGCSRYTQMLWADTFKVGCGISKCSAILVNGRVWTDATIMVCDYVPGGNWINRRPYVTGDVCSECHDTDTCVNNLCSNPARDLEVRPDAVWSDWSGWSQCPVTCGRGGSRKRTRYCSTFVKKDCSDNPFARTMELDFNCAGHIPCPGTFGFIMTKTARWNRWDDWSPCTKKCGGGVSMRTRTCSSGRIVDCSGSSVMTIPCNMRPCPKWNNWRSWEGCSISCGGGTRIRTRACSSGNNADCGGSHTESGTCNEMSCSSMPEWDPWQAWQACNVTCGGGKKIRVRDCSTGNHKDCEGIKQESEVCNENICPDWETWQAWESCSTTCGGGLKTRNRLCNTGNDEDCEGDKQEMEHCNENICPEWDDWQPWKMCTATCGNGTKTRTRGCNTGNDEDCEGEKEEIEYCNERICQEWNLWQSWGECSETCSGGIKVRTRTCNTGNDEECKGTNQETEACSGNPCPLPEWNGWQKWSSCNQPCDGGERVRNRTCSTGSDEDCEGTNTETGTCNEEPCLEAVDAEWNPWKDWNNCTKTCGGGNKTRRRSCNTGNDEDCDGENIETESCNQDPCPEWEAWQDWESCSTTCGGGNRTRRRSCNTGNDGDCGEYSTETEYCNEHVCPAWEAWQNWENCSTSCGGGNRTRRRSCNTGNDEDCQGDNTETEYCNEQVCPEWEAWQDWENCSTSCGGGNRTRSRSCNTGNDEDCQGEKEEIEKCNDNICPEWGEWQTWNSCSVSCGGGEKIRTRICNTGNKEDCGGTHQETDVCNEQACVQPEWGSWSRWSRCSPRCGPGNRRRTRSCLTGKQEDCIGEAQASKYCKVRNCRKN